MKMLIKCSRSAHFCSLIMYIRISGFSAVYGILQVQWRHHQCELGGDIGILRFRVCSFRRMLPVKFLQQTSHRSHVLSAVNMKSQFCIYFINGKVFMNKTCYTLNHNFKYSDPLENVSFTFTMHSWLHGGDV
jgi:hypothetical protein